MTELEGNMHKLSENEVFAPCSNIKKIVNEMWNSLDIIFQLTLIKYRQADKRLEFDTFMKELRFDESQRGYVYHCLSNYIEEDEVTQSVVQRNVNILSMLPLSSNSNSGNNMINVEQNMHLSVDDKESLHTNELSLEVHPGDKRRRNESDDCIQSLLQCKKRKKSMSKMGNIVDSDDKYKQKNGEIDLKQQELWDDDKYVPPEEQKKLEENNFYFVEKIKSHRNREKMKEQFEYKVKWYNYGDIYNTWEPTESLPTKYIKEYWIENKLNADYKIAMEELKQLSRNDFDENDNNSESDDRQEIEKSGEDKKKLNERS